MKTFKVGDRVRAVKRCSGGTFKKGWIGTVKEVDTYGVPYFIRFDNGKYAWARPKEIKLIDEPSTYKVGDRVRAVKKSSHLAKFEKGWEGVIEEISDEIPNIYVLFYKDNYIWWVTADEIELIEADNMKEFKVGDRVRVVKESEYGAVFVKGWEGEIKTIEDTHPKYGIVFDNDNMEWWVDIDEIELIESTPKQFPEIKQAIDDLNMHLKGINTEQFKAIYNYFAQFQYEKTVEVFPEAGKEYEFSDDKKTWHKNRFEGFKAMRFNSTWSHIRPIQPSRLEQLKAKHPNLTQDEQTELLELLLTQMKE